MWPRALSNIQLAPPCWLTTWSWGWRGKPLDLQHEVNATEAEIKTTTARLQKEGPTSSQGQSDTKLLSDLSGAAQSYQLQLDVVQNEIAQDKLDSGSVSATSQVLEAANIATSPSRLRMPEYIALGILGGLLLAPSSHTQPDAVIDGFVAVKASLQPRGPTCCSHYRLYAEGRQMTGSRCSRSGCPVSPKGLGSADCLGHLASR